MYVEFKHDNMSGYTDDELQALNAEWTERAEALGLEPNTDEYEQQVKRFHDEVARRQ